MELPVVQAGMGGGSASGGLGTIGLLAPAELRREIAVVRALSDKPLAVNLLLPFARRAHFEAAAEADVLVTFWGRPERRTRNVWMHQCGSVQEALEARAAGADAVIAQGCEAGGHVRGSMPAVELLAAVRSAVGEDYPVLSAGGIATAAEVASRLRLGAEAAVCGTIFLMTDESGAHPAYKERLVQARETILTELFGAGWPASHRVIANEATSRWLRGDPRGPAWLRALHRASAPVLSRAPLTLQLRLAGAQRASRPVFGPAAATADGPPNLIDAGPLYAGQCVERIADIRPAHERVHALVP